MPLHLLGKKSWNVYAPANIERVRRDEAAAAAKEEETERRMQEHDAERRIAILRGDRPTSQSPEPVPERDLTRRKDNGEGNDRRRKRRRLIGEDDTDRDIRTAKEDAAMVAASRQNFRTSINKTSNAPLHGRDGHINLFPIDARTGRADKNKEAEAEMQKKKREYEDQYTMRFSNAAGRDGLDRPWYSKQSSENMAFEQGKHEPEDKNVWGRPDPRRKERNALRTSSHDPLAFMKKAQVQLKDSERDRQRWKHERAREMRQLHRPQDDGRRNSIPQSRDDDMETFSLDGSNHQSAQHDDKAQHSQHRTRHHDIGKKSQHGRPSRSSRASEPQDRQYNKARKD